MTRTWLITWTGGGHLTAAAVVEAEEFLHALHVCDELGITPDGAARGEQIVDYVAPELRNRLLTPGELGRIAIEPPAGGKQAMSYIVTMTIRVYLFDCDKDGCTETREVRALNLDRARDKIHEAGWTSSFSKALSYCPAHADEALGGTS